MKEIWRALVKAGKGFMKDKVPKLSASLAYYTLFSIGPMLLVIIFIIDMIWGQQAVQGLIVQQLESVTGKQVAAQIQEIIKNASVDSSSTFAAIIGFVTLFMGASTVFIEIQDTINYIWNLRLKENTGWRKVLSTRLLSFSIVISLGFLLLVSLIVNTLLEGLMDKLQTMFPQASVTLVYIVNLAITLLVTTILFGIIYKVLPDARIRWRDVIAGAIFTAVLFIIGKFGITLYLEKADVASAYGAAGSLVVLLLWVYYSSMILYFGAEFTKFYTIRSGARIRPNSYSVAIKMVEVADDSAAPGPEKSATP